MRRINFVQNNFWTEVFQTKLIKRKNLQNSRIKNPIEIFGLYY